MSRVGPGVGLNDPSGSFQLQMFQDSVIPIGPFLLWMFHGSGGLGMFGNVAIRIWGLVGFFGMSCAGPGPGLKDPCEAVPLRTFYIPSGTFPVIPGNILDTRGKHM